MTLKYLLVHLLTSSMSMMICSSNNVHRQHLQIFWNSSNDFFRTTGFLTVYLGDSIDFLCPHYDDHNDTIEYNTIYLVNEDDYHHCRTFDYQPLIKCQKPFDYQRLIYTLSISKYLPYPNLPEFDHGQLYYFICTSSGLVEEIDQRSNGLCETKQMKLILNVEKFSNSPTPWSRPIVAKRTNLTFLNQDERLFLFSSSSSLTVKFSLFIFLLLLMKFS